MRIKVTETQVMAMRGYVLKHPRLFSVLIVVALMGLSILAWDAAKIVPYEELHVHEGVYEALEYVPHDRHNSEHWQLRLDEMEFKINPVIGFDEAVFLNTVQKGDVLTVRQDDKSSPWIEEIKIGDETIHSYEKSLAAYKENGWVWKSLLGVWALILIWGWFKLQYEVRKIKKKRKETGK